MKLALDELKFYKFRYMLILLIVMLLASMVLFITGLAQGLARENVSLLNSFKAEYYIVESDAEQQLEKSKLTKEMQQAAEKITDVDPIQLALMTTKFDGQNEEIIYTNIRNDDKPPLSEGRYPKHSNEVILNHKLTGEGLNIGDRISVQDTKLKVVGFTKHTMHAHANVGLVTSQGLENITNHRMAVAAYPLDDKSESQIHNLKDIEGASVVSKDELKDAIPSYQAEQLPLNMMIVSLFVITAIVLTAFFYVMTIQKTSEIGILKAIGIKTSHLLAALILQIVSVTMLGVVVGILLVLGVSLILPITMPFVMTPIIVLSAVIIFMIVALVGALLSFIRVYKVDPIAAIGGGLA
ncbi:ABC transporter permease [Staphylococcus sp. 17KM0847]|uniref:ABC transporter permease n=1 Tax=Staphylococcus sp. 17KM0847 TaxID=2583989 RepID=UPI0015DC28D7|nr:ABC transporter permease [Staphylococcus sp. 17KM0847]QLK86720.1 ABC transporter permease [Staphylococcus sp. 17KM0847]